MHVFNFVYKAQTFQAQIASSYKLSRRRTEGASVLFLGSNTDTKQTYTQRASLKLKLWKQKLHFTRSSGEKTTILLKRTVELHFPSEVRMWLCFVFHCQNDNYWEVKRKTQTHKHSKSCSQVFSGNLHNSRWSFSTTENRKLVLCMMMQSEHETFSFSKGLYTKLKTCTLNLKSDCIALAVTRTIDW